MIIHLQFGFSQFISFREEDLWNFSQSEDIIGPGSHIEYPTGTKNITFVEDHPRNIPAKFEMWKVYRRQTTDDRRQVMAIVHLDLWSRWTKKIILQSKIKISKNYKWIVEKKNNYKNIWWKIMQGTLSMWIDSQQCKKTWLSSSLFLVLDVYKLLCFRPWCNLYNIFIMIYLVITFCCVIGRLGFLCICL